VLIETLAFGAALLFSPRSGWLAGRRRAPGTAAPAG